MKDLNKYINENLQNNIINEGKIWDAIKNFFKKIFSQDDNKYLFKPSKKKFDRFDPNDFITTHNDEYKEYLKSNFNFKFLASDKKTPKLVKEIINHHDELNFDIDESHTYYVGIFISKNIKDVVYIVDGEIFNKEEKDNSKDYYIYNIHIINEYKEYISMKDISDILLNQKKEMKWNEIEIDNLIITEKDNKELYKQLIKDCNFKENSSEKIATLSKETDNKEDIEKN